ncbi:helix-turn-helix domain-containing protein [Cupriavidus sp. Marseille-Q8015]
MKAATAIKPSLTDSQRENLVRQAMTRFVRNRNLPEELEDLRYRLICARVLSGMTAVEAAQRFGYANSTQLSLIESGQRKTPSDWKFIRQAAEVYSVSTDYLLGLSPHAEIDGKVAQQYAMMRGAEGMVNSVAAMLTTAMVQWTNQTAPVPEDFEKVTAAVDELAGAVETLRKHGVDELRGSSLLVSAMARLQEAAAPVRQKLRRFQSIDSYFSDLRAGKAEPIGYLVERFQQRELPLA